MSAFTDRLYREWRSSSGGSGVLIGTGRPASPSKTKIQKAENRSAPTPRLPVQNPMKESSNHGISKV